GGCSNTPKLQPQCTPSSSHSTTTPLHGPNRSSKNPSDRPSMIAHSQPKKASASNKDGKDSDPKTRRGQTHISAYNPSLPPSDRQHKEPKSCTGRFRASTTMSLSLILDPAPTVWSSPCD